MVDSFRGTYSITQVLRVLGIAKSSYYAAFKRSESKRSQQNKELLTMIRQIWFDSRKLYGAPKIHAELRKKSKRVGIKRVQRIMKENGIRSIVQKKYRPAHGAACSKEQPERLNLVNQNFDVRTVGNVVFTDITYIYTKRDRWVYLASFYDAKTKRIVGWNMSRTIDTALVLEAYNRMKVQLSSTKNLIIHSDQGVQYTSTAYIEALKNDGYRASYSRKAYPYDNACIESFHSVLKKELVYRMQFNDFEDAHLRIFQYIEGWYNNQRIHSALGYRTPNEYAKLLAQQKVS
ncbi:IS3 family transposase [Aneurinibacillus sp. Ricciae_BoGa-3]|nr:IS3 family transposase [Aneurinibacillus sp. Ricciae_BoGa-3]WCK56833.1 IS3 family transposase [Aneurinibacillus sp. Ricciae_BoGa-3]WCK56859.1 IS3 family transposase [Aneurinibacillus sp. Ricciae_BoGa-3]WCK56903.1 IS3 family transposase [Aneurinibacillus sp. Ricciae_BoGa-3]WCK56910.1 IS3 family transposase [Aneurinibacillus sp. Ricciae_BoGa-3]